MYTQKLAEKLLNVWIENKTALKQNTSVKTCAGAGLMEGSARYTLHLNGPAWPGNREIEMQICKYFTCQAVLLDRSYGTLL